MSGKKEEVNHEQYLAVVLQKAYAEGAANLRAGERLTSGQFTGAQCIAYGYVQCMRALGVKESEFINKCLAMGLITDLFLINEVKVDGV